MLWVLFVKWAWNHALDENFPYPMPVKEVGMASIDVACLHTDEVSDELIGRIDGFLKERYDDCVKFLF